MTKYTVFEQRVTQNKMFSGMSKLLFSIQWKWTDTRDSGGQHSLSLFREHSLIDFIYLSLNITTKSKIVT